MNVLKDNSFVLIISTIIIFSALSCKSLKQTSDVSSIQSADSGELSIKNDISEQTESSEQIIIELCSDGNCPCGNGFCAENSVCIKDTCFCGADLDKGFISENAIASNLYGEFKCIRYYHEPPAFECCYEANYDFICTHPDGCTTGDGNKYPLTDTDVDYFDEDNNTALLIYDGTQRVHDSDFEEYESLLEHHRLNKCGKEPSENLKYMDRSKLLKQTTELVFMDEFDSYSHVNDYNPEMLLEENLSQSDLDCELREKCNDSSVPPDHITEYACEIGKAYFRLGAYPADRKTITGLRCIHPEGCSCGNTHCSQYAICQKGSCIYDIYYQNHACPDKHWDSSKNDIKNYMLSTEAKKCPCSNDEYDRDCYLACMDVYFGPDWDAREEECKTVCSYGEDGNYTSSDECYEQCYWDNYPSTKTQKDPCKK